MCDLGLCASMWEKQTTVGLSIREGGFFFLAHLLHPVILSWTPKISNSVKAPLCGS